MVIVVDVGSCVVEFWAAFVVKDASDGLEVIDLEVSREEPGVNVVDDE